MQFIKKSCLSSPSRCSARIHSWSCTFLFSSMIFLTRSSVSIGAPVCVLILSLNFSKCETSFFSVDPHQANLHPNLFLFNSHLRFNPTPTFLRITLDRTLSFSKHVSSLKAKFFPRLKALRCMSASSWGSFKKSLSLLYKDFLGHFSLMHHQDGFLF